MRAILFVRVCVRVRRDGSRHLDLTSYLRTTDCAHTQGNLYSVSVVRDVTRPKRDREISIDTNLVINVLTYYVLSAHFCCDFILRIKRGHSQTESNAHVIAFDSVFTSSALDVGGGRINSRRIKACR